MVTPKGSQVRTQTAGSLHTDQTNKHNHTLYFNHSLLYAIVSWHTLFAVLPPLLTLCPHSHQPIFFPSSPSRVRKGSCRFSTGTWRSMAQCIMRPRGPRRSPPSWRTTACCPSMSCSNCCERPRQDSEGNITDTHPPSAAVSLLLSFLAMSSTSYTYYNNWSQAMWADRGVAAKSGREVNAGVNRGE